MWAKFVRQPNPRQRLHAGGGRQSVSLPEFAGLRAVRKEQDADSLVCPVCRRWRDRAAQKRSQELRRTECEDPPK